MPNQTRQAMRLRLRPMFDSNRPGPAVAAHEETPGRPQVSSHPLGGPGEARVGGEHSAFFHPDLLELPADGKPPFLKGYRCKACGQLDFPKPTVCTSCWCETFTIEPLSRRGTLYSFSEIHVGQAGMATPYMFGYIDLPEQLRIFARLLGGIGDFACDELVELTTGPIRISHNGKPLSSYLFRKATAHDLPA